MLFLIVNTSHFTINTQLGIQKSGKANLPIEIFFIALVQAEERNLSLPAR